VRGGEVRWTVREGEGEGEEHLLRDIKWLVKILRVKSPLELKILMRK